MKIGYALIIAALISCKSTQTVEPESDVKTLTSERLTVKEKNTISPNLVNQLKDMAAENDVCFGKLTTGTNKDVYGLYLCVYAPDKLSPSTSLTFDTGMDSVMKDGFRTQFLTRNGVNVGTVKLINNVWTLTDICTGTDYDAKCRIAFDNTGFHFSFRFTWDSTKWTYSIFEEYSLTDDVAAILGNINGQRFCFGMLKYELGYNYALYPCNKTLTSANVIRVWTADNRIYNLQMNDFLVDGKKVASMWVWRDKWQLSSFCRYNNQTTCHLTYNAANNETKLHFDN